MYQKDNFLAPAFYDENEFKINPENKRIGYYLDDGWFDTAPTIKRAVLEAKVALERKGYELVPFSIPDPEHMVKLYAGIVSAEGKMNNYRRGLNGEKMLDEYQSIFNIAKIPNFLRPGLSKVLGLVGEERKSALLVASKQKTTQEYWDYIVEVNKYRKKFMAKMREENIEALLAPGLSLPAVPHTKSKDLLMAFSTVFLYNLLHFPAGAVPITTVKPNEMRYEKVISQDQWANLAEETLRDSKGLPCGVQIITPPWKDERCLFLMKELELSGVTLSPSQLPFV